MVLGRIGGLAGRRARARRQRQDALQGEILRDIGFDALGTGEVLKFARDADAAIAPGEFCGYSTFCGPKKHLGLSADVRDIAGRFYFVSNNDDCLRRAEALGWRPVLLNTPVVADPVVSASQAKIAKALPHLFGVLSAHDHTFYFDDKKASAPAQARHVFEVLSRQDSALQVARHPFLKGSILLELATAMGQGRYWRQRVQTVDFISDMLRQGLTLEGHDLFWTAYIFRDMRHPDTGAINEDWYRGINACGIECQISFDFVAQKHASIRCFDLAEVLVE